MNFSPQPTPLLKIEWSNPAIQKIKEIKEKFLFYPEYNLPDALNNALNCYEQEKSIRDQDTSSKQCNEIIQLLLSKLVTVTEIPSLMEAIGTKNRDSMIDYFKSAPEPRHTRRIEINNQEIFLDVTLSNVEDKITELLPDISRVITACKQVIAQIPPNKPGLKANTSLIKRFIPYLIKIYEDGTGKEPKCEWNRTEEEIFSECDVHLFVIEIASIFRDELNLELGKDSALTEYAKKFWREYKKRVKQHY